MRDARVMGNARCTPHPKMLVDGAAYFPRDGALVGVTIPPVGVNTTHLYYVLNVTSLTATTGPRGHLMRVPLSGGEPAEIASFPDALDGLLVTEAGAVIARGPEAGHGTIELVSADGSGTSIVAQTSGRVSSLVSDHETLYFSDGDATKSVPLNGGSVQVVTLTRGELGLSGRTLLLASGNSPGDVLSVPLDGGSTITLAGDQPLPISPVACDPDVCWLNSGLEGSVMRVAPDGGSAVALLGGLPLPHLLLFDGESLFVTTSHGPSVIRVPPEGGAGYSVSTLAGFGTTGMALDERCLYFSGSNGIFSVSRDAADAAVGQDY